MYGANMQAKSAWSSGLMGMAGQLGGAHLKNYDAFKSTPSGGSPYKGENTASGGWEYGVSGGN